MISIPRHKLRAKIARGVQLGVPPERLAELRSAYHAAAIRDHITEVADRLLPEQRRELADILVGGDADAA